MEPRTRYAKTSDGVNVAYAIVGEGDPVISVSNVWGDLHLYQHTPFMRAYFDALASQNLKILLFDARGMGASDHGDEIRFDLASRVRDLEAVAATSGFDSFGLTGFAVGCPVAIEYAAANSERISSMLLVSGFARGSDWYADVPAMQVSHQLQQMAHSDWETYTLAMASALMQFSRPETANVLAKAYRESASSKEYLAWMRETALIDVTSRLPLITVPTLVVSMSNLVVKAQALSRDLAAGITNAEFLELEPRSGTAEIMAAFLAGRPVRKTSEASSGAFRTILFTDLVGHTEMMRRLGDERGRAVLREHETLTRKVLKQHGGSEVKTMGDGFLASFPSVTRAVECAIALQKAIAERNATAEEPLNVRVGLNAGEPIEEDGDLFGETVILAARIAAMAQGGEILSSLGVRELCAGKGFLFGDRGEHVMKGFEDAVRVFEISWRG